MNYQSPQRPEKQIIRLDVQGVVTLGRAEQARRRAAELARRRKSRRILADWTHAEIRLTTLDIYDLVTSNTAHFPSGSKIAVVVSPGAVHPDDLRLFEDASANRGLLFGSFETVAEAEQWLNA